MNPVILRLSRPRRANVPGEIRVIRHPLLDVQSTRPPARGCSAHALVTVGWWIAIVVAAFNLTSALLASGSLAGAANSPRSWFFVEAGVLLAALVQALVHWFRFRGWSDVQLGTVDNFRIVARLRGSLAAPIAATFDDDYSSSRTTSS